MLDSCDIRLTKSRITAGYLAIPRGYLRYDRDAAFCS